MPRLDRDTLNELVDLLRPLLTDDRRSLLTLAFGINAPVLSRVTYNGSVESFIVRTAEQLTDYGEVEPGKPALCALLEQVKPRVGLDQRVRIDKLLSVLERQSLPTVSANTVFLSAANNDLVVQEYRMTAKDLIQAEFSHRWHALDRQDLYPGGSPPIEVCHDAALSCGAYIGLLGPFYGSVNEKENLSYTEYEFRVAKDAKQRICVFLLPGEVPSGISLEALVEQGPLFARQLAFRQFVESEELGITVEHVVSVDDFRDSLRAYLHELERPTDTAPLALAPPKSRPFLGMYPHLNYDRRPVVACTLDDLDGNLINAFLDQPAAQMELRRAGLPRATREERLKFLGVLHDEGPTVGAFLCFAPYRLLQDKFAACHLHMVVYSDTRRALSRASPEIVRDNLINLFEIGTELLSTESGLQRTGQIGTSERDELEIPEIALREALANALVHRDYEQPHSKDQPTRIEIYPDRVEITSFGGLPEGVSEEALNEDPERVTPIRRNHVIAEIFRIMQNAELDASGIGRMREATKRVNLPPPRIIQERGLPAVKVIFQRRPLSDRLQQFAPTRLQNLRDFTVQIRHAQTDAIVGSGIAVSVDGKIVTCAHVVAAAGVNPRAGRPIPRSWEMIWESIWGRKPDALADAEDAEVGVYFPQARGDEEKARRARVAACFPQHDDDVVLLQLVGGPAPLGPEQIPVLGRAEPSQDNPFRSYGYRRLEKYIAGHAHGMILGSIERPQGQALLGEPVQLISQQINRGMSGAAVLDVERNLVVGIISETWFPDRSITDRDTAWAVNARVLSLEPFGLELQDEPHPKRPAPEPKTDVEAARAAVAPDLGIAWNNAPAPLEEWVGREELLPAITRDWADPERRVTGLIGFGGEGTSSLARQSVENLLSLPPSKTEEGAGMGAAPDGVFWWGFYSRSSVDEFFEAALAYMSGGRIDPPRLPSANVQAQVVGGMLGAGRYLFILDGLEVMQHQEGDRYGLLKSADLRDFLSYFAGPGHQSFCLITSRAPVLDLLEYTTYTHRDVPRLSPADGRALLRAVGVVGDDEALDRVVADWDGHALTLSLLGGYLADRHGGDVAHITEIPPPLADEPRYERVHRVLRRYDEHLTGAEFAFLTLFSAFRTPVEETAFDKVFRAGRGEVTSPLHAPIAALDDAAFQAMVQRLVAYSILRYDPREGHYTAHPLIRNHYAERLKEADQAQVQAAHQRIKDYYLDLAGDTPRYPTLDDLAPLIEAVHHACHAGAYDEAERIRWERVDQRDRRVLVWQLGAYETQLALMQEFFPGGDTSQEPQVSDSKNKNWILNEAGFCLMSLGRLGEAPPFWERKIATEIGMEDWHNASIGYNNLADLHAYLGSLDASAEAAREALALARRAENKRDELGSLTRQARITHLRGDLTAAGALFQQAEALQREIDPDVHHLYSLQGIHYADYLWRTGDAAYARRVTGANLEICERARWPDDLSRCHRVLGDLDADSGQHDSARQHYDQALKIARGITVRDILIEALLARGRWAARLKATLAKVSEPSQGLDPFSDLNEALDYAVDGGYRRYEADIRVALAWAHLAAGNRQAARAEAERAQRMSADMGYHWDQVDAAEVLEALDQR